MRIIILLLNLLIGTNVYAHTAEVATNCPSSVARWDTDLPPSDMVKNNNMQRKTGSADFAEGEFINIEGKILDSKCVPVTEAVVEIWQADANGMSVVADEPPADINFAYSGTAITDNLGRFVFFSVAPGTEPGKKPYINIRIRHADFMPFESKVYFSDNTSTNCIERNKKNIDKHKRNLLFLRRTGTVESSTAYEILLTLEGVNKYKRY